MNGNFINDGGCIQIIYKNKTMKDKLTQKEAKRLFSYDEKSGILIWKNKTHKKSRIRIGDIAGTENDQGYLVVRIKNKNYKVHRIIWLILYGYFPENSIDLILIETEKIIVVLIYEKYQISAIQEILEIFQIIHPV